MGQEAPWHEAYLHPVSDHAILQRMLYNLKAIYVQQGDYQRALGAVERLLLLSPEATTEVRDRGLLHYQLGHLEAALDDLQHYLQLALDAPDAAAIRRHVAALQQQLRPLRRCQSPQHRRGIFPYVLPGGFGIISSYRLMHRSMPQ